MGIFKNFSLLLLLFFSASLAWADPAKQDLKEIQMIQEGQGKILAETADQVRLLRQEVQELKGIVEETRYFYRQETEKNARMLRDFDFRLTGIEERISLHQKQLEELLARRPPTAKEKSGVGEEAEYRRALSEVNLSNFKEAIRLFDEFLKKHPASSLADNAQYWKGEALYALRDFTAALVEFQKVVEKYASSDKVPGAILKQGLCLFEKQLYQDAKVFLNKVIQDYPKSDEASEAGERVQKVDQLLAKGTAGAATEPVKP